MILFFGYLCVEFQMEVPDIASLSGYDVITQKSHSEAGGHAIHQAIAAARSGAKVSLSGTIGTDLFGKKILETIRREGIQSTAIAKSDKPTGILNIITDDNGSYTSILAVGANSQSRNSQIPAMALNEKTLLLLQSDIEPRINLALLKNAKKGNAHTMLCITNPNNITKEFMDHLDILVIKDKDEEAFKAQINITPETSMAMIAKQKQMHIIITQEQSTNGAHAFSKTGQYYSCDRRIHPDMIIDKSGAQDTFCGSLAACIQAGLPLPRGLEHACAAARLTTSKTGIYGAIPYLDSIAQHLNKEKA